MTVEAEKQNIEWKEIWRDEYLKWICGFANADGGILYIGKNDKGEVVGVDNYQKYLEDIPNKIRNYLGIIADVNLLQEQELMYIEIIVSRSSYPVNYKGEYHYRTGSTKLQLQGNMLTEFLLRKTGLKWDAVPVDNVTYDDLDKESIELFCKEALRNSRIKEADLQGGTRHLLECL